LPHQHTFSCQTRQPALLYFISNFYGKKGQKPSLSPLPSPIQQTPLSLPFKSLYRKKNNKNQPPLKHKLLPHKLKINKKKTSIIIYLYNLVCFIFFEKVI